MRAAAVLAFLGAMGCAQAPLVAGLLPVHPRGSDDRVAFPALLHWEAWTADDVRYELRVFDRASDGLLRAIYTRRDLREPRHLVEVELKRRETYFWTVRAWFRTGGRWRATPWSQVVDHKGQVLPPSAGGATPEGWLPLVTEGP